MKSSENEILKLLANCCDKIEKLTSQFHQYLVKNAYIIVAIDGTPLFTSGKKAFELTKKHLENLVVLNQLSGFVLLITKTFVVLIAGMLNYELVAVRLDEIKFFLLILIINDCFPA